MNEAFALIDGGDHSASGSPYRSPWHTMGFATQIIKSVLSICNLISKWVQICKFIVLAVSASWTTITHLQNRNDASLIQLFLVYSKVSCDHSMTIEKYIYWNILRETQTKTRRRYCNQNNLNLAPTPLHSQERTRR